MNEILQMITQFGTTAVLAAALIWQSLTLNSKMTEALTNNTRALTELTAYVKGAKQ